MTIANWEDIDIKLVEPMKAAGISTVEDLLGVVKIAQACKELEAATGIGMQQIIKSFRSSSQLGENGDCLNEPLSEEYIKARDHILKKNKELYERLS